ncbi:hypothetical protein [Reichenbachiella sp. MSK19-1]|uniref:hypothetical protein n=1 Tax=Reichenbachiella sp. MSK19-1 TaxID=1897631 RepID=UPI000E6D4A13|nr:hypothetical protein [Reichenbachiella sp. MSK19-1]RJE74363.1 hypothetical protein BGP76_14450 [Reichenbachiella sp. MSK19-1]
MATNLELRSTYFYTEGMGSIPTATSPKPLNTASEISSIFKNKFAVATHISESIHRGIGKELASMTTNLSAKRLASKINSSLDNTSKYSLADIVDDLRGYDFNEESSFDALVKTKFCVKSGAHKGHAIFHVPAFIPIDDIKVPKQATNFKISARLVSVSDFLIKTDSIEMLSPKADSKKGSFQSPMLPILQTSTEPMTAQLRLLETGPIAQNASTVLVIGVMFYRYEDKKFVALDEEGIISIRNVF